MAKLTIKKRLLIQQYLALDMNRDKIAEEIGVHRATLYREINRGKVDGKYSAYQAQKLSVANQHRKGRRKKGDENET